MSSSNAPRFIRLAAALALAGLTAGCFQPMYGNQSPAPGGGSGLADKLSSVEVLQIPAANGTHLARLGVDIRNELIFGFNGGSQPASSQYTLRINLVSSTRQVIVDINSARPEIQNYGIDAVYALIDSATGKQVVNGQTFARVSYNIPGQLQRFAGDRGLRDAENRAAKVIAENIRNRVASYFVAGT